MKHEPLFRGSAVALVTPLRGGKVDVEALHRLVEMHVDNGTAAIVACGTTGEPATLTPDERELVIREVVAAARGRVPVICGTGSNCTQTVIDTERRYRGLGCVAQLVVTPYYNKTTQEGLYAHFMAIAEHTELPIVLYNVPGRTGLDIAPETIDRLAESGRFVAPEGKQLRPAPRDGEDQRHARPAHPVFRQRRHDLSPAGPWRGGRHLGAGQCGSRLCKRYDRRLFLRQDGEKRSPCRPNACRWCAPCSARSAPSPASTPWNCSACAGASCACR